MSTRDENLAAALDRDFAPAWRPEPGDKLIGRVVELGERTTEYGTYPIVTVQTDEGERFAAHAIHTVLASQLAGKRPKVGERIGIVYRGKVKGDEREYHSYRVEVERDGDAAVDWSRHADAEEGDFVPF
jgi:hypothetical protein